MPDCLPSPFLTSYPHPDRNTTMEKEPLYRGVPEPPPRRRQSSMTRRERLKTILWTLSLAAVCFLAINQNWRYYLYYRFTGQSPHVMIPSSHTLEDMWESITPSTELEWHDCYEQFTPPGQSPFQCARLTVPLDYNAADARHDHDEDNQVHLALVLRPAKNGSTKSSKAPMLVNPGGPGGSGTMIALVLAQAMQTIFGDDQPIIGFDPRGIGYTTPSSDCWSAPPPKECVGSDGEECPEDPNTGMLHRLEWIKQNGAYGFINSTDVSLKFLEAGHRAVNKLCTARDQRHGGKSILRHASTAHVARDMLSIVDAWDRWVDGTSVSTRKESEKSGLVYWGFSYGTYLGIKFASMFPDRVGRLMLDGVVDAEYYESPVWTESLLDTDKILDLFFEFCADASYPGQCAFHREGDTPSSVKKRYTHVMNRLQYGEPITFTHPTYFYPVVMQSELFRTLVFTMLYSPKAMFPALGVMLDNLYEERYDAFLMYFGDMVQLCGSVSPALGRVLNDAQRAVMCSDKSAPVNQTQQEIWFAFEKMSANSQFADIWMSLMMQCNGWDLFEKDPLLKSQSDTTSTQNTRHNWIETASQINTSFPILFLSNTLDPVTPLKAAVKMALRFNGAGLLEQKSAGHCTISSASRCTAKVLKGYINEGKVPPPPKFPSSKDGAASDENLLKGEWMTCEADEKIGRSLVKVESFPGMETRSLVEENDDLVKMEEEDRKVIEAVLKIQEHLRRSRIWEFTKRPMV